MWEGNCWLSPSSWATWRNTGMSTLRFAWLALRTLVLNGPEMFSQPSPAQELQLRSLSPPWESFQPQSLKMEQATCRKVSYLMRTPEGKLFRAPSSLALNSSRATSVCFGQPVPGPLYPPHHSSSREEFLPKFQLNSALSQLEAIPPRAVPAGSCPKSSPNSP